MTVARRETYRVGMVGTGIKGTEYAHAYALNPATEVVAAADPDSENLELFCKRFNVPGYSSSEEMFRKEQIDIATPIMPVIANPEVVIGCARTGVGIKAIYCEKPIAATLADADRMVQECRSRGLPLGVGDVTINFPELWNAKDLIDSGRLGEVRSINIYVGGVEISGSGCHFLGLMRMYAGFADLEWVVGWMWGDPFSDWDHVIGGGAGYMRFVNGIEAFMHRSPVAKRGIEVLCTRGVFATDFDTLHVWELPKGADSGNPKMSDLKEIEGALPDIGPDDKSHDAEGWRRPGKRMAGSVQSIVDSLDKGIEPRSSGDNMRKALEIAIALRESHRRDHSKVRLPIEDRSLKIMPHETRWAYKKDLYGKQRYREMLERIKLT